jgi:plasmid stability protein
VATLTIRNVPPKVVKTLKGLARENHRSMEQEVRALLDEYAGDRLALLEQIEAGWTRQARRPSRREVDAWVDTGRR